MNRQETEHRLEQIAVERQALITESENLTKELRAEPELRHGDYGLCTYKGKTYAFNSWNVRSVNEMFLTDLTGTVYEGITNPDKVEDIVVLGNIDELKEQAKPLKEFKAEGTAESGGGQIEARISADGGGIILQFIDVDSIGMIRLSKETSEAFSMKFRRLLRTFKTGD